MKRRRSGERGIALVEMAFVSLIILGLVAAAVDFGLGWRSGMVLTEAARTGARVGSGQAKSIAADYNALSGVRAALDTSGKLDDVEQVIVFRSDNANGVVPTSCINASGGNCTVFTGSQFRALNDNSWDIVWAANPADPPTGGTGCPKSGAAQRRAWCPINRNNIQSSSEFYGVYIRYRHDHLFPGILGDDTTVTRTAVMRLEPPAS